MSTTAPLPADDHYVKSARQSCRQAATALNLIPNLFAIDAFLTTLDGPTYNRLRTQHGLSFPLRFPTPTAEVNFLSILALLNAFSGYRAAFHRTTGIGAYQNMVRFMIVLYISGSGDGAEDRIVGSPALTAKGMAGLTEAKVVELLGVSIHEEKQHDTLPGVTVGLRGGQMLDCVQLIHSTLVNVGNKLLEIDQPSIGAYVVSLLKATKEKGLKDVEATDYLVKEISTTFAEFRDTHTLEGGKQVFLFKRIFFLLHSLHLRFGGKQDWAVPNTYKTLPMFVDNVLPTLCVWFNFFTTPSQPAAKMETLFEWVGKAHCNADLPRSKLNTSEKNVDGPKLSIDETYAIRAATLHIGQVIVERANELAKEKAGELQWLAQMNEVDLDGYLWAVAKDDAELRKVPRLVFPSIHF